MKYTNEAGEEIPQKAVQVLYNLADKLKGNILKLNNQLEEIEKEINSIQIINEG